MSILTSVGVSFRRLMVSGAIGAVADVAPYALMLYMLLLNVRPPPPLSAERGQPARAIPNHDPSSSRTGNIRAPCLERRTPCVRRRMLRWYLLRRLPAGKVPADWW